MPTVTGRLRTPALASAPSSPAAGEVYYDTVSNKLFHWNGSVWVPVPKITSGAIASGPPASPADGDVWMATAVGTGTVWQFRYNAGSASAYKWEFIGGPPVILTVATSESTTTNFPTYADLTTAGPGFVVPRGGDYQWEAGCIAANSTAGSGAIFNVWTVTGAAADDNVLALTFTTARATLFSQGLLISVASGDTIRMKYSALTSGTATFERRHIMIWPLRVS